MADAPFSCASFLNDPTTVKLFPTESDGAVFHIHKKLLAFRSTYFHEALQNDPQHGFLLETDSPTLSLFVDWVYTDAVPFQNTPANFQQLFGLFLLAQKLIVEAVLLLETIGSCYGEIEANSPLRRWLLKYVAWLIVNEELDLAKYTSLVEDGSAADLIQTLVEVPAPFRDPRGESDCLYHAHAEHVECAARSFAGSG